MAITSRVLLDEINKRLTLNLLIQGASQHVSFTLHHLVREQLTAIDRKLLRLYDQFALIGLLQYWSGDLVALLGHPTRFWQRAAFLPTHPFFQHPLLSRHGGMLAAAARKRATERCKEKGVTRIPVLHSIQAMCLMLRLALKETPHTTALLELAKHATVLVWGIPAERLDGDLTYRVAFGDLSPSRSFRTKMLRACVAAYGGVMRRDESVTVVAKGINWPLLAQELVKGTAELICLHGLNNLTDDMYSRVMSAADKLEYEPWMVQVGGELWRRLLMLVSDGRPVSEILMHLARLPAQSLMTLMLAVIERPEWAKELIAGLGHAQAQ